MDGAAWMILLLSGIITVGYWAFFGVGEWVSPATSLGMRLLRSVPGVLALVGCVLIPVFAQPGLSQPRLTVAIMACLAPALIILAHSTVRRAVTGRLRGEDPPRSDTSIPPRRPLQTRAVAGVALLGTALATLAFLPATAARMIGVSIPREPGLWMSLVGLALLVVAMPLLVLLEIRAQRRP